ncbi:MAG: HupE/UreJ family protein [Bryobacteraceae bacterium]|jgi:HupE / UreJ protein
MRRTSAAFIAGCVLLCARGAFAHRIDEYLQGTILSLETNRVQASMRLIPGILVAPSVIAGIDTNGDGAFSESEERTYARRVLGDLAIAINGTSLQPALVSWSFPEPAQMREGLGEIHIEYTVELPYGGQNRNLTLTNHHLNHTSVYLMNALVPQGPAIRIVAQKRNEQQSFYELDYLQAGVPGAGPRMSWGSAAAWLSGMQFSSLFRLGMHHIAEGTDHLLFLLVLLLPAPLLASNLRWGGASGTRQSLFRILGIVTAFTIGHSITLTLAAFNAVNVPSRPVEALIAVSILVSAVHAYRPLFPGKEALIAAFFGLIHGLAFAATLSRLGLGRWDRVAGILSFNLGIEAMQMIVVAAILPSLMLMSRTRAYTVLRIGGAVFAGCASTGWMIDRLFDLATPVDTIVNAFARHSLLIAVNLLVVSLACRLLLASRVQQTA